MTTPKIDQPSGSERRKCQRRPVTGRSAIWLDEGPEQGILGTISEISTAGFSVRLLASPPETFQYGAVIFCVLLLQGAHIDCLARICSINTLESGSIKIGFSTEALSNQNQRLLAGIHHYLRDQKDDG